MSSESKRDASGRWTPGVSGNPTGAGAGRPPMPEELRKIKALTQGQVKRAISRLLTMPREELERILRAAKEQQENPQLRLEAKDQQALASLNNLEWMIAAVIMKGMTEGDHGRLNFLLDRTIGKVVEERRVQLEPVTYKTTVRGDGALVQEVIRESLGEDDGDVLDVPAGDYAGEPHKGPVDSSTQPDVGKTTHE